MAKFLKQINITLLLLALLAGAALIVYFSVRGDKPSESARITLTPARIKSLTEMARLTTLEIDEETGMNDTINGKGIFAIVRLQGTISFDVDHLRIDSIGSDSLRVYLPEEKVELLESTDADSYRIVDVWNVRYPLLPAHLSTAEENAVKRRLINSKKQSVYTKGHVNQARRSALETLRQLYGAMPGLTVEVVDEKATSKK